MIDDLLARLRAHYIFDQDHNTALSVLETIFTLLAGGFIGSLISKFNLHDLIFALIFSICTVYLAYRRISRERNFSVSPLGELKSTIDVENKTKEVERKNIIDNYIDDAVKALNSNTCNYNNTNIENNLCNESLENGLKSVYQPFFNNPQNLLDTPKAKFTVGAYLNYFYILPSEIGRELFIPLGHNNVFVPRDDFDFKQYFAEDFLKNEGVLDLAFEFQRQFLDTHKHNRFRSQLLSLEDGREFSVITAPIPSVCEDGPIGIFFIVCESLRALPSDFENLSKIFGRLFSNWLNKYNECIYNRCMQANAQIQKSNISTI